uniref:DekiORF95 n=1 Tax=Dendrolimus kikuchii nucleopolyhedrovirus TaxID=1219875 RepID=V9LSV3_9ABAC|nr:DekiORF95 [Dendrolimus kikuchii nucleopolyhedrovirus]
MYQIPDMLYKESMPPRAKKLFVKTFSKFHKLNGGDEDVAMQKARKALEEKYVKIDYLNNSWIPRTAAYEIVKDDIDTDDNDDDDDDDDDNDEDKSNDNYAIQKLKPLNRTNYDTDNSDNEADMIIGNNSSSSKGVKKKYLSNTMSAARPANRFRRHQQQHNRTSPETSDDDDDNDDDDDDDYDYYVD